MHFGRLFQNLGIVLLKNLALVHFSVEHQNENMFDVCIHQNENTVLTVMKAISEQAEMKWSSRADI